MNLKNYHFFNNLLFFFVFQVVLVVRLLDLQDLDHQILDRLDSALPQLEEEVVLLVHGDKNNENKLEFYSPFAKNIMEKKFKNSLWVVHI